MNKTNTITLDSKLASKIGSNPALILQQLIFWTPKSKNTFNNKRGWVYNSTREWKEKFLSHLSVSTIKRAIKKLEDNKLVYSEKVNAHKGNHTKWYLVNFNKVKTLLKDSGDNSIYRFIQKMAFAQNEPIDCVKMNQSYTYKKHTYDNSSYKEKPRFVKKKKPDKTGEEVLKQNEIEKFKDTVTQMKKAWDEVFRYSLKPIKAYYNQKNLRQLKHLFENIFQNSLQKWREYALSVNSSKFLMGEKKNTDFRASFAWLIKTETVEKILAGEYGVGDREPDLNNIQHNIEKKKQEVAQQMCNKLISSIVDDTDVKQAEKEFESLLAKPEHKRDQRGEIIQTEDEYGLRKQAQEWGTTPHGLLYNPRYGALRRSLFETYLTKRKCGLDKLQLQSMAKTHLERLKQPQTPGVFQKPKDLSAVFTGGYMQVDLWRPVEEKRLFGESWWSQGCAR